jgi:hypothetical protein
MGHDTSELGQSFAGDVGWQFLYAFQGCFGQLGKAEQPMDSPRQWGRERSSYALPLAQEEAQSPERCMQFATSSSPQTPETLLPGSCSLHLIWLVIYHQFSLSRTQLLLRACDPFPHLHHQPTSHHLPTALTHHHSPWPPRYADFHRDAFAQKRPSKQSPNRKHRR